VFYRINAGSPSPPPSVNALMRRLRQRQLPTLLLWGQNDPWITAARAQRLKAIYPEVTRARAPTRQASPAPTDPRGSSQQGLER
jgi:pimeloyl-ACP methyl ester carboxylesterase